MAASCMPLSRRQQSRPPLAPSIFPSRPSTPRRLNVDRLVLRQDALARWTLIHRSLGAKKPVPAKKSRKWGVTTKSA